MWRALLLTALLMAGFIPCRPAHAADPPAAASTDPVTPQPRDLVSWAQTQSALCSTAITAAEVATATPAGLLGAVAKAESGRPLPPRGVLGAWPWTINLEGQGYFFDTKAAAIAFARDATAQRPRSMDVGCMQVNMLYHPTAFRSLEDAFDPATNAAYAARFLRSLRDGPGAGNWYQAVGFYHSQTPDLAAFYRERVAAIAEGRAPPSGGPMPLFQRAIQRGSVRLALAGGGVLVFRIRQPGRPPRRSACDIVRTMGDFLPPQARHCTPTGPSRRPIPNASIQNREDPPT